MIGMVAAGVGLGLTSLRWPAALWLAAGVVIVFAQPSLAIPAIAAAGLSAAVRRWLVERRRTRALMADVATLCDLTAVALTGGLTVHQSLDLAAREVGGEIAAEVAALLRYARIDGIASALATSDGAGKKLYRVMAKAAATGSSLTDPVTRLANEINAEQAVVRLEAVRKVPVLMLFPLTLLILPGFLLLAIAPTIIDAFSRIGF